VLRRPSKKIIDRAGVTWCCEDRQNNEGRVIVLQTNGAAAAITELFIDLDGVTCCCGGRRKNEGCCAAAGSARNSENDFVILGQKTNSKAEPARSYFSRSSKTKHKNSYSNKVTRGRFP